jgi:hypothetical protein
VYKCISKGTERGEKRKKEYGAKRDRQAYREGQRERVPCTKVHCQIQTEKAIENNRVHTHTRTHTCTNTNTYSIHTYTSTHTHTHTHTLIQAHTHTLIQANTHT